MDDFHKITKEQYEDLVYLRDIVQKFIDKNITLNQDGELPFFNMGRFMLSKSGNMLTLLLNMLGCAVKDNPDQAHFSGLVLDACYRVFIEDCVTFLWIYYCPDRSKQAEKFEKFAQIEAYELKRLEYELRKDNPLLDGDLKQPPPDKLKRQADKIKEEFDFEKFQKEQRGKRVSWNSFSGLSFQKIISEVKKGVGEDKNAALNARKHIQEIEWGYKTACKSVHTSPYYLLIYGNFLSPPSNHDELLQDLVRKSLSNINMCVPSIYWYTLNILEVDGQVELALKFKEELSKQPNNVQT